MSAAQTPCPSWCETDHDRETDHAHFLGEFDHVQVRLYVWPTSGETVVRLTNRRTARIGDQSITDIEMSEVPGMAALMVSLGHSELAELLRDADELFEDEDEQAVIV